MSNQPISRSAAVAVAGSNVDVATLVAAITRATLDTMRAEGVIGESNVVASTGSVHSVEVPADRKSGVAVAVPIVKPRGNELVPVVAVPEVQSGLVKPVDDGLNMSGDEDDDEGDVGFAVPPPPGVGVPMDDGVGAAEEFHDAESWSDIVAGAVERKAVEEDSPSASGSDDKKPFMRTYVRIPEVRAFAEELERVCGHRLPKSAHGELALLRFTPATVPSDFLQGRARIKALALLGDAACKAALVQFFYRRGEVVELAVKVDGSLKNLIMSRSFAKHSLSRHVHVGTNINLGETKTGADHFEAVAGVLQLFCGTDAVVRYMRAMGWKL